MSYGLQILNDDGKLLVLDDYLCPWLVGKATVASVGSWYDGGAGYEVRQVQYSVPGSGPRMLAMVLPVTTLDLWHEAASEITSGSTLVLFQFRPLGSANVPVNATIYAFSLAPPPASSSGYGMQVWNSAGQLVLDTGSRPFAIKAVGAHAVGQSGTAIPGGLANPALVLPSTAQHFFVGFGPNNTSTLYYRIGAYRVTAAGLSSKFIQESTEGVDAYFDGPFTFGSTLSQAVPVLDSSLYE